MEISQASCGILPVLLCGGWGEVVHPEGMQLGSSNSPCLLAPLFQKEWECVRSKSSYWKRRVSNHYPTGTSLGAAGRGQRGIGSTLPWQPLVPGFAPAASNPSEKRMKMQKTVLCCSNVWVTLEARRGFCWPRSSVFLVLVLSHAIFSFPWLC